MPKNSTVIRYDRIAEELKKAISEVIRELRDPRVSDMTTVTRVETSSDLMLARVRVSVYEGENENGSAQRRQATVDALNGARGFISREVGRRIDIRRVPELRFTLDESIEYSAHISKILSDLNIDKDKD